MLAKARKLLQRDRHDIHVILHRHRRFQLIITAGTIATALTAFLVPHHGELIVMAGTATNLIWIWE